MVATMRHGDGSLSVARPWVIMGSMASIWDPDFSVSCERQNWSREWTCCSWWSVWRWLTWLTMVLAGQVDWWMRGLIVAWTYTMIRVLGRTRQFETIVTEFPIGRVVDWPIYRTWENCYLLKKFSIDHYLQIFLLIITNEYKFLSINITNNTFINEF